MQIPSHHHQTNHLYGQIQSLVQKYEETARTLTGQTLTTGAWILKVTSSQASLGPSQPTNLLKGSPFGMDAGPPNTRQDKAELMAYLLIITSALPTFRKWGMFRTKLSKSGRERNLNAKPKTKTNKTKHLADNKPGNGRYPQALMEIITKLRETACKPFPRLQFLSEGKRGAWFVEQELEMVTHKVAHLSATEG